MTLVLVPAPALGDGVLAMPLAHGAHAAGREVLVLHDGLTALGPWYPWARVAPAQPDALRAALATADAAFIGDPAVSGADLPWPSPCVHFGKDDWLRDRPYGISLQRACQSTLGLEAWSAVSGAEAPTPMPRDPRQVLLHPTSARTTKNWPPQRWLALAAQLRARDWQPAFLVAPDEESTWRAHAGDALPVVVPGPLDRVAGALAGAGGVIATDSGIAHLASAVGTPTLTIFRKPSAARFWVPAWGRCAAVTAPLRFPGEGGHRLWRLLLTPGRVLQRFEALMRPG